MSFDFETLRFQKSGKEIITAVNGRIEKKIKAVEEIKGKISEIAKARGITADEVVNAGDDVEAVESYSNKMSSHSGFDRSKPNTMTGVMREVVEALEKDTRALREHGRVAANLRRDVDGLTRVKNALNETRTFDLTYYELETLGFS